MFLMLFGRVYIRTQLVVIDNETKKFTH